MKKHSEKSGFTIVELLTVMSVIAILIGLLVPALNLVQRMAKDTRQKAQFHSITVAMEIYNGDQEAYPNSAVKGTSKYTVGAQHLAEALVGRDLLGFDQKSTQDAEDDAGEDIYTNSDESLDRRKGPYLNPENVESYQIQQLYSDTGNVYDGNSTPAPVLTDAYRVKTVTLPNNKQAKAGSPILYYKANTSSKIFDYTDPTNSIFNIYDNDELVALGKLPNQDKLHEIDSSVTGAVQKFYEEVIFNPKITTMDRPYNQSSYILISAGYDGLYGTRDDIFNFSE